MTLAKFLSLLSSETRKGQLECRNWGGLRTSIGNCCPIEVVGGQPCHPNGGLGLPSKLVGEIMIAADDNAATISLWYDNPTRRKKLIDLRRRLFKACKVPFKAGL